MQPGAKGTWGREGLGSVRGWSLGLGGPGGCEGMKARVWQAMVLQPLRGWGL